MTPTLSNQVAGIVLDRQDLSDEKKSAIRELHIRSDRQGLINVLTILLMYGLSCLLLSLPGSLLLGVIGFFAMACTLMRAGFMMHEAAHGTLFKSRLMNQIGGLICGVPVGFPPSPYRYVHNIHHATERTESDPDDLRYMARRLHVHLTLLQWVMFLIVTPGYLLKTATICIWQGLTRRRWEFLIEYAVMITFFALLAYYLTPRQFMHYYGYPVLLAFIVMNVRSNAEHELTEDSSAFTRTRTVLSTRFVRWLMFNANYHLEHHLYPGVPSVNLPLLHQLLAEEENVARSPIATGYSSYYREFFQKTGSRLVRDCIRRVRIAQRMS